MNAAPQTKPSTAPTPGDKAIISVAVSSLSNPLSEVCFRFPDLSLRTAQPRLSVRISLAAHESHITYQRMTGGPTPTSSYKANGRGQGGCPPPAPP